MAYDLLDLTKDAEYVDLRAHEIVKRLNEETDSPWHEKIKMQGVGPGLITQGSFIERLRSHLSPNTGIGYLEAEPQYLAIRNFWQAVKELQPEAWGNSAYLLTKTLGFSALMDVFGLVAQKGLTDKDFSTAHLKNVMKPLASFDFSSGGLKGLAGSRGRIELRERLVAKLKLQTRPQAQSIKF